MLRKRSRSDVISRARSRPFTAAVQPARVEERRVPTRNQAKGTQVRSRTRFLELSHHAAVRLVVRGLFRAGWGRPRPAVWGP